MTTFDLSKLPDDLRLVAGHHDISAEHEGCAMDAIAWAATGEITDMPSCVHPFLARKVHSINDDEMTTGDDRWLIVREGGPILVGSDRWEVMRACLVIARSGATAAGFVAALRQAVDADLANAYLAGADLAGAYLAGANLAGANLAGADLAGAYLAGANLAGTYLAGATLARANLANAYLAGADLAGAVADKWTRWPDGFEVPSTVRVLS